MVRVGRDPKDPLVPIPLGGDGSRWSSGWGYVPLDQETSMPLLGTGHP